MKDNGLHSERIVVAISLPQFSSNSTNRFILSELSFLAKLNENGELIGQIREATRGLCLWNCRAVWDVGLFLSQYLCNGFNMADAGELKYSHFYFDTGRKAFKFKRVKTIHSTEAKKGLT